METTDEGAARDELLTRAIEARRRLRGCLLTGLLWIAVLAALGLGAYLAERLHAREFGVRYRAQLLAAAAVLTAGWLGSMAVVRTVRQPVDPDPAPPSPELGPEPPAVANLLVSNFRPTREAVAATVLDVATRGALDVVDIGGGSVELHVPDDAGTGRWTDYERRVLVAVRRRARGGVVPAHAVTTGAGREATRWWRGFSKEVGADARARGLSENLWPRGSVNVFAVVTLVPAALLALAYYDVAAGFAYALPALAIVFTAREGERQRHTPAGLVAAGRWLGVRDALRAAGMADASPGAIRGLGRQLAYAAALGVGRSAVAAMPLGQEDDRLAWSSHGGRWRRVRVRYGGGVLRPGWGRSPAAVLGMSVPFLFLGVGLLVLVNAIGWPEPAAGLRGGWVRALRIGLPVVGALAVGLAAASLTTIVRAARDLGTSVEVVGEVVRMRRFGEGSSESPPRCYVAIDDGSADSIRAFRLDCGLYAGAGVEQGGQAVATVTPSLGYVRALRPA